MGKIIHREIRRPAYSARESEEYDKVSSILGSEEKSRDPFLSRVSQVIRGPGFFLATDAPERGEREQRQMLKALAETPEQVAAITEFFYETTKGLIAKDSYKLVGGKGSALDIVRDVFRVVPIRWVAIQVVSEAFLLGDRQRLTGNIISPLGRYHA